MVSEAEAHRAEDDARRQLIEARNRADAIIYQTEKAIEEAGENLPVNLRQSLESQIEIVRSAITGEDASAIDDATNRLHETAQEIGAYLSSQASAGQPEPAGSPEPPGSPEPETPSDDAGDKDVIDGDYRAA